MKNSMQPVGRPREFDEANVLDSVMKLFWEQGYERTALSDILSVTGLAKGSIYKAFQSKHNLYLKSLERYEDLHVNSAVEALRSDRDPISRLDSFLSAPIKNTSVKGKNKGCFLCNASADRADSDPETRALVQRSFTKLAMALASTVSELKPNWNEQQIQNSAQMLLSIYSGLRIMSRSGVDTARLRSAKLAALFSLN